MGRSRDGGVEALASESWKSGCAFATVEWDAVTMLVGGLCVGVTSNSLHCGVFD